MEVVINNGENEERELSSPMWNRYVEKHRVNAVTKAGIPDFMLQERGGPRRQTAMAEVKTPWSYTAEAIRNTLAYTNYNNNGQVRWRAQSLANDILRQVSDSTHC